MSLTKVYLGVGSNLNRENAILFACSKLKALLENVSISSVYESHAVRVAEPDYYNVVVGGYTNLSLDELYKELQDIEHEAGSEPMFHNSTNFGQKRRVDIDILTFGDEVRSVPCKVPRHDIQDYPFVLCPLVELESDFIHPLLNIKVLEIWNEMYPRLPERMQVNKVDFDVNKEFTSW